MDTPEASTVSQSVIDPLVSTIQGYGLEEEFENKLTKILEKLGSEMEVVKFVPSPDLVSLVEELQEFAEEEEWEEDEEDDLDVLDDADNADEIM